MVVLGYSRLLWMRFLPRQTMDALRRGQGNRPDRLVTAATMTGGQPQESIGGRFPRLVGREGEGAAAKLALRRTETRKGRVLCGGTPSNALGASRIAMLADGARFSACTPSTVVVGRREHHGDIEIPGRGAWREIDAWLAAARWLVEGEGERAADWLATDVGYQQTTVMDACERLNVADAAPTKTADGRRLWLVGGYNLKQTQVERLQSGTIVVSDRVADEVVAELCGEELRHRLHRWRGRQRWAQTRDREEASDCLTYAIACWRSVVDVGAAA